MNSRVDFVNEATRIRRQLGQATVHDVFAGAIASEDAAAIDLLLRRERKRERLPIDIITLRNAWKRGRDIWGVTEGDLDEWCVTTYNDNGLMPYIAQCFVVAAFPDDVGIYWGEGIVTTHCPSLVYDDANLVTDQSRDAIFTKEGLLTDRYYFHYDQLISDYGLQKSNGFLEYLLWARRANNSVKRFGIAVSPDVVLERSYHSTIFTREFIRGPRGISIDQLRRADFPENPSGTVTVHQRDWHNFSDVQRLFFPDIDALQIMWTYREDIKSVQIEELVPLDARSFKHDSCVANRYVHAQWDTKNEQFIHFDGAVRIYSKDRYPQRLATDLRQLRRGVVEIKADEYRKLFRIDAPLNLETWCQLVARFYNGNELVTEYLGGEVKSA